MKLLSVITGILFISNILSAQDISGVWTGNYSKHAFAATPEKLVVEIFVYKDSLITGASHLYYKNNTYEHYKIYGVIRKQDGIIYFSEDSTIAVKLGSLEENCLGNYTMKLINTDTSLMLKGRWEDNSASLFHCASSDVWLQKKILSSVKQTTTGRTESLERRSDIQSLVEISEAEKDSIEIAVYDNGVIDNDSVSLYLNDSLLIHKQVISNKPIILRISLDGKKPLSKLILAAESLGSIPPCTALMFITTKKKRYEVNLSSNFNSNGVIELFLKK
jgi:hypothetical protein